MNVYTSSNQVRELITSQTHIDVEPFDNHVPESKEVNLFLLDDHLIQSNYQQEEKVCLHETMLLRRRPDWGGMILQMAKFNDHVYLFDRQWYRVQYNPETYYFKFKVCDTPNLVARHNCILPNCCLLLKKEKQAIQTLLKPVIFGEQLAERLLDVNAITNPKLLTQARGDYEKLCLNLEQVTLGLVYERDCWKNQFFSHNYVN